MSKFDKLYSKIISEWGVSLSEPRPRSDEPSDYDYAPTEQDDVNLSEPRSSEPGDYDYAPTEQEIIGGQEDPEYFEDVEDPKGPEDSEDSEDPEDEDSNQQ